MMKTSGVFREGLQFSQNTVGSGGFGGGFTVSSGSDSGSHTTGRVGKGRDVLDNSDGEDNGEDKQGDGGGGGRNGGDGDDGGDTGGISSRNRGPKFLSIPFFSNLVIKDDKREILSRFTSSAVVNVKVRRNPIDPWLSLI
jgi:hypothetical protein